MASFFIPLTGPESDSTALNTIANDLANMNTTAFKAETTNFSDLFYQEIGSTGAGKSDSSGRGRAGRARMRPHLRRARSTRPATRRMWP